MAEYLIRDKRGMLKKYRTWNQRVKLILTLMLKTVWHKKYAPGHFTMQAYFRYGGKYKKRFERLRRSEKKQGIKARMRAPMLHSGTMRRLVLSSINVTGSAKLIRGRLPGSRVANLHTGNNPKTGGYNMVQELRAINFDEEEKMAAFVEERLAAWLNRNENA